MEPISAEAWLDRFTMELGRFVQDEGVRPEDLASCADDAIEDARYRNLGPEEAARLWARDFA